MTDRVLETTAVFRELMAELTALDGKFFDGPVPLADEQSVLEGYKWIFSLLRVALDVNVWADPTRPRFVDIVGPYTKWGGDNADAFYQFAPIDPSRTYRVRGRTGDAVYFSLTVYGGPRDGRYSDRIVGTINDRSLDVAPDGTFQIMLSAHEQPGAWLRLEPDAVAAITRDYVIEPRTARRMDWSIECLDPAPPFRERDVELAQKLRAALTWVREQARLVPLPLGDPNTVEEPYPVPKVTYGWAAADAAYAMGTFDLADDESLVITGRSPECAFWNMCLWNQFLHTYNYDHERVTINGGQLVYEPDGSWTIVVAHRDPGHPNWVTPAGHPRGRIWFRWFHPAETPARPQTCVVKV